MRPGVAIIAALLLADVATSKSAAADNGVAMVGLDGLDLGRWSGRGDLVAADAHCVGVSRRGPPRFNVEAFGDGPGGAFELTNGRSRLPFTLRYDDGTGPRELEAGRLLRNVKGSPDNRGLQRCLRGEHGARNRLEVRVHARDLARVTAGRFHGRILLTVSPE